MWDWASSASWMISSARSVSIAVMPAAASASLSPISSVAIDLTLTTSSAPCARAMPVTMAFASAASRAQCTVPPAAVTDASRRSSCAGEVASSARSLIAAPASRRASQSDDLGHDPRALGPDRRRRLAQVAAQLGVAEGDAGGGGEAHVDASTSARCIVRTPARCRRRPPPMCIRHEVSAATQTSAPVSSTWRSLSVEHRRRRVGVLDREGPAEAAALLGLRQLDEVDAADRAQQPQRPVAERRAGAARGRTGGR